MTKRQYPAQLLSGNTPNRGRYSSLPQTTVDKGVTPRQPLKLWTQAAPARKLSKPRIALTSLIRGRMILAVFVGIVSFAQLSKS